VSLFQIVNQTLLPIYVEQGLIFFVKVQGGLFYVAQAKAQFPQGVFMAISLNVNGKAVSVDADPNTPILWALRDNLDLTGTKFGCGMALCGACTVHMNGSAIRSCVTPISAAVGQRITTIEAQAQDKVGKAVQDAWVKHDVAQCGYCQSGQVMVATALLKANKKPSDQQIDEAMAGNICRCGTYQRIRAAVKDAAQAAA
jgi:isoquinoline 1-oxidoreductase subunit alpha